MHYKWEVSKHFHTSLGTHISRKPPPAEKFHRFLLLKGAVHHCKVTNLDTVDGELGVERKCKIQLYLWQHTQISHSQYTWTKISWRIEGSPNVSEGSGDTSASQQFKPFWWPPQAYVNFESSPFQCSDSLGPQQCPLVTSFSSVAAAGTQPPPRAHIGLWEHTHSGMFLPVGCCWHTLWTHT